MRPTCYGCSKQAVYRLVKWGIDEKCFYGEGNGIQYAMSKRFACVDHAIELRELGWKPE